MAEFMFYMNSNHSTPVTLRLVRDNDGQVLYNDSPQNTTFGYFKIALDSDGKFKNEKSVSYSFR